MGRRGGGWVSIVPGSKSCQNTLHIISLTSQVWIWDIVLYMHYNCVLHMLSSKLPSHGAGVTGIMSGELDTPLLVDKARLGTTVVPDAIVVVLLLPAKERQKKKASYSFN